MRPSSTTVVGVVGGDVAPSIPETLPGVKPRGPGRSGVADGGILLPTTSPGDRLVTGSGIVAAAQKEREWSEVAS
jgi:hypothetical protein